MNVIDKKSMLFRRRNIIDSNIFDLYSTPRWGTELMLSYINIPKNYKILEPCNGLGSIGDIFIEQGYNTTTFDIDKNNKADLYLDFLNYNKQNEFDVIITNPPYKFNGSNEFDRKAIEIVKENGLVIILGQLHKFESLTRKKFYDEFMPKLILVHSKRFVINGKCGIGYCWFIYQKNYNKETILKII